MSIIRNLQEISNDKAMSLDKKLESLLRIGTEALRLETGIVSNIQGERYSILSVVTPDDDIPKGAEFSLCDTYCADVARADTVIAYHNIDVQPGASHPCFDKYTLKSYLASPICVFGEFYGTVNFSSLSSRDEPFNELETDYLLLLATWIGNELERQQSMSNLNAQKVVFEERNSLLKQVTNLAGVGTWELDIESGSVIWSGALKRMFHVHNERVMQTEDILKFIADEGHRKRYAEEFEQKMQTGEDFLYEVEVRTDAGETRWIESRAHPIMNNGRCVKVVGATVDITQMHIDKAVLQHKSDLAQNALKARGDFLANMSQEIRTPIHGVQGMLEALMASPLNSKQMELASLAVQSADSLLNIVNNILDFSKIDAGELVFEDAAINFAEAIEEQIPMFTRLAQEKGITFSVNASALKEQTFIADKLRLGQVLINLLNNAFKFTKEGEVTVETRCVRYGKGRYRVKLIVTDTGIGISPQQQKIIFMPYLQGETSQVESILAESNTQHSLGGTGLGLSIVKKIVDHYSGKIEISSELGIGARFTVTLTLDDANAIANTTAAQNDTYIPSKEELRAIRALIVEDNEINQIVIKEQLREIGLNTDLAINGAEAVEKVKRSIAERSPYAFILMDCHMPVMDGLEATKQIRLLGQQTSKIPIIALTANVSSGDKEKCLKSGMDDYISKPVGVSRLKECVFRHLSKQFVNVVSALKDPA